MNVTITVTTNLRTNVKRRYIDGRRVSQVRFDEYRSTGCFFTESTSKVRRLHAVAVHR